MRHEKIDTRALLNGTPGHANFTPPATRLAERQRVLDYWPGKLIREIRDGFVTPPPWRLLTDPTAWHDVDRRAVHGYVTEFMERHGRWPSIDGLHRAFGRVTNHRGPDEVPEQEGLFA